MSGIELRDTPTIPGVTQWPWITVGDKIKVVGALFSNSENIDKLNAELTIRNFHWELQKKLGFKGTILQKKKYL